MTGWALCKNQGLHTSARFTICLLLDLLLLAEQCMRALNTSGNSHASAL